MPSCREVATLKTTDNVRIGFTRRITVNITTIGRGTIGGGLARIWEQAGHKFTLLGHAGGDASDADAVLVAVPSGSISDALDGVAGLEGVFLKLAPAFYRFAAPGEL